MLSALFATGLGITDDDCVNFTQHFSEIGSFIENFDFDDSDSEMQMSFEVCKKFNIEGPNYAEKLEALMRSANYFEYLYLYLSDFSAPSYFLQTVLEGSEIKTIMEETDSDLLNCLTEEWGLNSWVEDIDSDSWEIITEHGDDFLLAAHHYVILKLSKLF